MDTKKTSCLGLAIAITLLALPCAQAQDASGRGPERVEPASAATPPTSAPRPFEELDTNADGAISKEEAAVDPPLAQAFATLDKDADGRLTPEEYAAYAQGKP